MKFSTKYKVYQGLPGLPGLPGKPGKPGNQISKNRHLALGRASYEVRVDTRVLPEAHFKTLLILPCCKCMQRICMLFKVYLYD